MPQIILQIQDFFLKVLIVFLKLIPFFFAIGYFPHQHFEFAFELPDLSRIIVFHLVHLLLIFVLSVDVVLMRFVLSGSASVVVMSQVHVRIITNTIIVII